MPCARHWHFHDANQRFFFVVMGAAELASLRTELRSLRQQWQEARAPSRAGKGVRKG